MVRWTVRVVSAATALVAAAILAAPALAGTPSTGLIGGGSSGGGALPLQQTAKSVGTAVTQATGPVASTASATQPATSQPPTAAAPAAQPVAQPVAQVVQPVAQAVAQVAQPVAEVAQPVAQAVAQVAQPVTQVAHTASTLTTTASAVVTNVGGPVVEATSSTTPLVQLPATTTGIARPGRKPSGSTSTSTSTSGPDSVPAPRVAALVDTQLDAQFGAQPVPVGGGSPAAPVSTTSRRHPGRAGAPAVSPAVRGKALLPWRPSGAPAFVGDAGRRSLSPNEHAARGFRGLLPDLPRSPRLPLTGAVTSGGGAGIGVVALLSAVLALVCPRLVRRLRRPVDRRVAPVLVAVLERPG